MQLQGRVERCGIRFTKHTVTIPLTPAITRVGGARVSDCLKRRRLRLVIHLPPAGPQRGGCLSKGQAKRYLRDKTLDIFVPVRKLQCRGRRAELHLKGGDVALLLLSSRMDTMLVESALPRGS